MDRIVSIPAARRAQLSRRALLSGGIGAAALVALRPWGGLAAPNGAVATPPAAWRTWLLTSPSELRPGRPGTERFRSDDLGAAQYKASNETSAAIARWGDGPAILPWTEVALGLIKQHRPSPVHAGRALALLHVAAYDAVVAARDAQAFYGRSTYPADHAVVAGAASTILNELFPDEPAGTVDDLAREAAASRVWTGAATREDVAVGFRLGQAVGERAVARARTDGAGAVWSDAAPTGEGLWQPTPPDYRADPLNPLAGAWQTWVLPSGDAARPVPPPAHGSPAWQAELGAVQDAVARRTPKQAAAAEFWAGGGGTVTPAGIWVEIAVDLIRRDELDLPHAARVLALTSVAMADAFICCWDAKFAYWMARPITADPELDVLIPTPPFPSYTSGHSTVSAAAATTLGHLFPADAPALAARAAEAADSRLWAGIHFPIDNEIGAVMGYQVGRLLAEIARADGAE